MRSTGDELQRSGQAIGENGGEGLHAFDGDALREEILAGVDRLDAEVRGSLEGRLRDAALSLEGRKVAERAKQALGVARSIREAGLVTSPLRDIPFVRALFERTFAMLAQTNQLRVPTGP